MSRTTSEANFVGGNLSSYRLVAKIGAGGREAIYLAADIKLERQVAIGLTPLLRRDKSLPTR